MSDNARPYRSLVGNATAALAQKGYTTCKFAVICSKNNEDNWLHLYNAATAAEVTVGTTTPVQSYPVATSDNTAYVMTDINMHDGLEFPNGLVFAVTKELSGAATAPDSNCVINLALS
jgi:hypothetical protein